MMRTNFPIRFAAFSLALVLGFASSKTVQAQSQPPSILAKSTVNFQPRSDIGTPGRRERLGTRGLCPQDGANASKPQKALTSLLPVRTAQANLGLTISGYPTFFFYLPETTGREVEFLLTDADDRKVYSSTFAVTGEPGVIGLSLPKNAGMAPLEIGKDYHWYFSIVCHPGDADKSSDPIVGGWIRRVEPSSPLLAEQLENSPLRDRVALYAADGIWYETLTALAQLRYDNPNDRALAQTWANLLRSVGLSDIAQESLIQ